MKFQCNTCGSKLPSEKLKNDHVKKYHDPAFISEDPNGCQYCSSGIQHSKNFQRHLLRLHPDKKPTYLNPVLSPSPAYVNHPFRMIIYGPSDCGKTTFWSRLVVENKQEFELIIVSYNQWVPAFDAISHLVTFVRGIPDNLHSDDVKRGCTKVLIIFDDLMSDVCCSRSVTDIFTKGSHNRGISAIQVVQDLFPTTAKSCVQQRLNTDYMVLFNSNINKSQVERLSSQMYPFDRQMMLKLYCDVVSTAPYAKLIIDVRPCLPTATYHTDVSSTPSSAIRIDPTSGDDDMASE